MPNNFGRAVNTGRGRHPDLDENGDFKADADLPLDRREFYRMWQDDAQRAAFMGEVARRQAQLPQEVQQTVAGQQYGYGDPYDGYGEYLADIRRLRSFSPDEVTSADVAAMSLEEYDARFDANGLPKPGTTFSRTSRDVDVASHDRVDPFSDFELRRRSE
ncbi:MAG TPA: hypothetical protein VGJ60_11250 [Chloroflexota bacterium]|jgi:hypothetical protein